MNLSVTKAAHFLISMVKSHAQKSYCSWSLIHSVPHPSFFYILMWYLYQKIAICIHKVLSEFAYRHHLKHQAMDKTLFFHFRQNTFKTIPSLTLNGTFMRRTHDLLASKTHWRSLPNPKWLGSLLRILWATLQNHGL